MAAPITWKNVNAPRTGAALVALNNAGRSLGDAISGIGDNLSSYADDRAQTETDAFLNEYNAERDPLKREAMVSEASKAFLDLGRVNEARTAAVAQDRAATTFDNQQTLFTQGQTDRTHMLARRGTLEGYQDDAARHANEDQTTENLATYTDLTRRNEARVGLGQPPLPIPEYLQRAFGNAVTPVEQAVQQLIPARGTAGASATTALDNAVKVTSNAITPLTTSTYKEAVRNTESSGGTQTVHPDPTITASGDFGINDPTARGLMRNNPGLTFEEAKGSKGFDLLTTEHRTALEKYDLQDHPGAVYARYVLGGNDGPKVFKALAEGRGDDPVSKFMSKNEIAKNPQWFGDGTVTAQDAVNRMSADVNSGPVNINSPAPTNASIIKNLTSGITTHAAIASAHKDFTDAYKLKRRGEVNAAADALLQQVYPVNSGSTDMQLYDAVTKMTGALQKHTDITPANARQAALDALTRVEIDTSHLTSEDSARDATADEATRTFGLALDAEAANPRQDSNTPSVISTLGAHAKQYGISAKELETQFAPQVIADLQKTLSADLIKSGVLIPSQDPETAGVLNVNGQSGAQNVISELARLRGKYQHIAGAEWTRFEDSLKQEWGVDTALAFKEKVKEGAIKRGEEQAKFENTVDAKRVANEEKHTLPSLYNEFPGEKQEILKGLVTTVANELPVFALPNYQWILAEAIKNTSTEDTDWMTGNDIEFKDNQTGFFDQYVPAKHIYGIKVEAQRLLKHYTKTLQKKVSIQGNQETMKYAMLARPVNEQTEEFAKFHAAMDAKFTPPTKSVKAMPKATVKSLAEFMSE